MTVSDFFLIQGEINKKFVRQITKRNKSAKPFISQKEFPAFISTIKEMNDEEFHSPK